MVTFKQISKNIGTVKIGSVTPVIFEFEGDINTISTVSPSCGCTANAKKTEPNFITAEFTATEVGNFSKKINIFFKNQSSLSLNIEGTGVAN